MPDSPQTDPSLAKKGWLPFWMFPVLMILMLGVGIRFQQQRERDDRERQQRQREERERREEREARENRERREREQEHHKDAVPPEK